MSLHKKKRKKKQKFPMCDIFTTISHKDVKTINFHRSFFRMIKERSRNIFVEAEEFRDYSMAPFITPSRSSSFKHRQEGGGSKEDTEAGIVVFRARNKIRFRSNKYCFVALLLKLTLPSPRTLRRFTQPLNRK